MDGQLGGPDGSVLTSALKGKTISQKPFHTMDYSRLAFGLYLTVMALKESKNSISGTEGKETFLVAPKEIDIFPMAHNKFPLFFLIIALLISGLSLIALLRLVYLQ